MSVPVITFFNNKGGVGKTSLVYHVASMLAVLGRRTLAVDLDPQGNLSAAFLDENRLETLVADDSDRKTIWGAIRPLRRGVGDIQNPHLERISDRLALVPGDMALSNFEDELSQQWPKCLDEDERAFRVIGAFWRLIQSGAKEHGADVILVDLGPNLGALNRSAVIASDSVVIPLGPDLFSLQGLQNVGPTLRNWRTQWQDRLVKRPADLELPGGLMKPIGYIVMQHSVRRDRPVKLYEKWIKRIPQAYRKYVLDEDVSDGAEDLSVDTDDHCFALLKHYRSLMAMSQESRKPIFDLRSADGALGAHVTAVRDAFQDFKTLATEVVRRAGISVPLPADDSRRQGDDASLFE